MKTNNKTKLEKSKKTKNLKKSKKSKKRIKINEKSLIINIILKYINYKQKY